MIWKIKNICVWKKFYSVYVGKYKWKNTICADTQANNQWNTVYFDKDWYVLHCEETFIDDMSF